MTDKPLVDVWTNRDFPVLVEVTRRIDSGATSVQASEVAAALDMTEDDVQLAGAALQRRQLVKAQGAAEVPVLLFFDVSSDAYLLTELHPDGDDALDQLISTLRQAADQTSDPEEKSQLRKAANALGDLAGKVGTSVMTAYLTGMLPGH